MIILNSISNEFYHEPSRTPTNLLFLIFLLFVLVRIVRGKKYGDKIK